MKMKIMMSKWALKWTSRTDTGQGSCTSVAFQVQRNIHPFEYFDFPPWPRHRIFRSLNKHLLCPFTKPHNAHTYISFISKRIHSIDFQHDYRHYQTGETRTEVYWSMKQQCVDVDVVHIFQKLSSRQKKANTVNLSFACWKLLIDIFSVRKGALKL